MKMTLGIIILILLGCSSEPVVVEETITPDQQAPNDLVPPQVAPLEIPKPALNLEWSYAGSNGPSAWGDIRPEYQTCKTGKTQSPVNLKWSKPVSGNLVKINYVPGQAQIENTGYTLRVRFPSTNSIQHNGETYTLEKMEIRTPTEHTLSGNSLPMEFQLYHKTSNGLKTAMISLIVIEGKPAPWFDEIWNQAKALNAGATSGTINVDPGQIIPPAKTYYQYTGSLTHPPCSEGVEWFIFNTPLQLSKEQISSFRQSFNENNRKPQPLNNRKVLNH